MIKIKTFMMKTNHINHHATGLSLLLAFVLSALTLSCSSGSDGDATAVTDREIQYEVAVGQGFMTRGSIITFQNNLRPYPVALSAVFDDNTNYFNQLQLRYNSGRWATAEKYYWPPRTISFFARYPYTDANMTDADNRDDTGFTYTVPQQAANHQDLMYGVARSRVMDGGVVPINLKHALAAITFNARTESATMTVNLSGIDLCNVYSSGTFSYPAGSTEDGSGDHEDRWTGKGTVTNLSAGILQTTLTTTMMQVTSGDGILMCIPQTITPWALPGDAESQSGTYLKLHCSLLSNGRYFVGSEGNDNGIIYVPFGQSLEAGYHYQVNISFGLGYSPSGETNQVKVDLQTNISPWAQETIEPVDPLRKDNN